MELKSGITGFFPRKKVGTLPEFMFTEFKHVAYGVAREAGIIISKLAESGVIPNFHSARFISADSSIEMLGNSTYPIIAFAEPWEAGNCKLRFKNVPRISSELQRLFPHLIIADSLELNRSFTHAELELLNEAELVQINYWKPATVGEVVFNWWD